jgi:hypothetical protein
LENGPKLPKEPNRTRHFIFQNFFKKKMGSRRDTSNWSHTVQFRNDPYDTLKPFHIETFEMERTISSNYAEVAKTILPPGTLRVGLLGKVPFIPFPAHVMDRSRIRDAAPPLSQRPESLVQLFVGQLPFKVTDAMICWVCEEFAESEVLFIERITQENSRKGCMQIYVDDSDADFIITAVNKRMILDTTGVWHAQNAEQQVAIEQHCQDERNRFKGHPFRPVVVERATSTYVRRRNAPRSRSRSPPPAMYEGGVADASSPYYEADHDMMMYQQGPPPPPPMYYYEDDYEGHNNSSHSSLPPPPPIYPVDDSMMMEGGEAGEVVEGPYSSFAQPPPPPMQYPPQDAMEDYDYNYATRPPPPPPAYGAEAPPGWVGDY